MAHSPGWSARWAPRGGFCLSLALAVVGSWACGGSQVPLDPNRPLLDLDTATRTEADRRWESGLEARHIRWQYRFATPLDNSLSVVGSFRATFVNTNLQGRIETGILIRLVEPDGRRHVAQLGLQRLTVPADSSVSVRENFIVELPDVQRANAMERLTISLP